MMEQKYGQARRTWVLDRGMVSEANLNFLRERGATYIVGTPKATAICMNGRGTGASGGWTV